MWIEAIKQGTPRSPTPGRKNEPKPDPKKKEEPVVQPPKYTQRQETVDIAAQVASEEASKNVEEVREQESLPTTVNPFKHN